MSTKRSVFAVLVMVAVFVAGVPVAGGAVRTPPVITVANYCDSVWATAQGDDLDDWWLEVETSAYTHRTPVAWGGAVYYHSDTADGVIDFSLYDGDVLVDELTGLDGTYVGPDGCDGGDPTWTVEVSVTCSEVVLTYEILDPYPPEYVAGITGFPGNEEVPFPTWPSGEFVIDAADRYRTYTVGLIWAGEGDWYFVPGSTHQLTAVEPVGCGIPPEPPVLSDVGCLYDEGDDFLSFGISWTVGEGEKSRVGSTDAPLSDDRELAFFGDDVPFSIYAYSPINLLTSGPATVTASMLPDCDMTPVDSFSDDDGSVFEADIEWMAAEGITKGCNPPVNDRFCPDGVVTRGQMAAFLVRALDLTDRLDDPFIDDDDSIFEADIERLAAAGITRGCNPPANDRFCPDGKVTREQMAAFLVRALNYTDDGGGDLFVDDDDSIFEADIDRLAAAGVTRGCNPPTNDRFCPSGYVTRGQMAAFLHRALG